MSTAFDPEQDLPPTGAQVIREGVMFEFDKTNLGCWTVMIVPPCSSSAVVGMVTRPFSESGLQVTRWWWEDQQSTHHQRVTVSADDPGR